MVIIFDLINAFDWLESSQKSDLFTPKRSIFLHACATYVLSYHLNNQVSDRILMTGSIFPIWKTTKTVLYLYNDLTYIQRVPTQQRGFDPDPTFENTGSDPRKKSRIRILPNFYLIKFTFYFFLLTCRVNIINILILYYHFTTSKV